MQYTDRFKEAAPGILSALENTRGAAYDNKAIFYERLVSTMLFNKLCWNVNRDDFKKFAAMPVLQSAGNVLDIGCGGLAQTADLYSRTTHICTLLDRSLEMLRIAKGRLTARCGAIPSNITLLQANAFQLPFDDSSYDTICSFGTIHLFDNKQDFLHEMLRVLKPGGKFYFYTMTNETIISRLFMELLRLFNEFGVVLSRQQTCALFDSKTLSVQHYMKGSVLFIYGQKLQ
ncbi:class I SAM-dependent methyltransferase [Chitinophaga solisilvae]|uniref:class I SAM-dependent methyltransferase n=1 Tax=Chitinophaga solisilvae TaxID=1233460 RepID=UPI00136D5218|nr:class I SAM-dependent methyltransferase [Chitinophaga solisilvae]